MNITSEHVTGFVVGLGAASLGFYMYKKNEGQIDEWLRSSRLVFPSPPARPRTSPASRWKNCCARRSGWKT